MRLLNILLVVVGRQPDCRGKPVKVAIGESRDWSVLRGVDYPREEIWLQGRPLTAEVLPAPFCAILL